MKKVHTQSNAKFKMSKDRKIAGYLIIGFALFWSICSILGFIAFCRTAKDDETVVASAEEVPSAGELTDNAPYLNLFTGFTLDTVGVPPVKSSGIASVSNDFVNRTFTMTFNTANIDTKIAWWDMVPSYLQTDYQRYFFSFNCSLPAGVTIRNYMYDEGFYSTNTNKFASSNTYYGTFNLLGRDGATTIDGSNYYLYVDISSSNAFPITLTFTDFSVYYIGYTNWNITNVSSIYAPPSVDYAVNSIPSIYQDGYSDGYNQGYTNGYVAGLADSFQAGYDKGQADLLNTIFAGSTLAVGYDGFYASVEDYNNGVLSNTTIQDFDFEVENSIIDCRQFGNYFNTSIPHYTGRLDSLVLQFEFSQIFSLSQLQSLFVEHRQALPIFESFWVGFSNDTRLNLTSLWNLNDDGIYRLDFSTLSAEQLALEVEWFELGLQVDNWLYADYYLGFKDSSYERGYTQGYSDGLVAGKEIGIVDGYDIGYTAGYNVGLEDGADFDNVYTFDRLISAVIDVPVNAFRSMFNFELLGVNLANFGFAILSVCLVLAVIKFIL